MPSEKRILCSQPLRSNNGDAVVSAFAAEGTNSFKVMCFSSWDLHWDDNLTWGTELHGADVNLSTPFLFTVSILLEAQNISIEGSSTMRH
jgi:hypothetical protein